MSLRSLLAMETTNSKERYLDNLDLGAPFISTRRSSGSIGVTKTNSKEDSPRVPFSWERAAGVPKDSVRRQSSYVSMPPKPPPGRRQPHTEERGLHVNRCTPRTDDDGGNDTSTDRGDGRKEEEEEIFADALDRLSLSEPSGFVNGLDELDGPSINRTPSFIMSRFLLAANALANSTAIKASKSSRRRDPPYSLQHPQKELVKPRPRHWTTTDAKLPIGCVPPIKTRPQPTPKVGVPMVLSPWSLNHRLCGFKSPVRFRTPAPMRTEDSSGDGLGCEPNGSVGGCHDRSNTKSWQSSGWGRCLF